MSPMLIGWREWVSLPGFNIVRIKAKIDTGARTSALHTHSIKILEQKNQVHFTLHSQRSSLKKLISCVADLIDIRWIIDSGGHREKRCVIQTDIILGDQQAPIEITLTHRPNMRFKMLLGRTALKGRFIIDPGSSYLYGKKKSKIP